MDKVMACVDCLQVALYGDEHLDVLVSDFGEELGTERYMEVSHSLDSLGNNVCAGDFENMEEFSWTPCECCGSKDGGSRYELVVLNLD